MSKEQFLNQLFDAHIKDLNDFQPDMGAVFVCPICLTKFPREAISQKILTEGHVWPRDIRKKSKLASDMRVLLCKNCNSTAGSFGDRQMQLHRKVKKGEKTGELFGNRKVQLFTAPDEAPINLQVKVSKLDDNSLNITGRIGENLNWLDSSPDDQARFLELVTSGQKANIVVHPHKDLRPELVSSGWITSAYLMAFYGLGYRYVLHPALNPVRELICKSFEKDATKDQMHPDEENLSIREYISEYFEDPELLIIIPLDNEQLIFLQINYFEYEIRLPFRCSPSILDWMIRSKNPNWDEQLPSIINKGRYIYFKVDCTKTNPHECMYDFLLGKTATVPQKDDPK